MELAPIQPRNGIGKNTKFHISQKILSQSQFDRWSEKWAWNACFWTAFNYISASNACCIIPYILPPFAFLLLPFILSILFCDAWCGSLRNDLCSTDDKITYVRWCSSRSNANLWFRFCFFFLLFHLIFRRFPIEYTICINLHTLHSPRGYDNENKNKETRRIYRFDWIDSGHHFRENTDDKWNVSRAKCENLTIFPFI